MGLNERVPFGGTAHFHMRHAMSLAMRPASRAGAERDAAPRTCLAACAWGVSMHQMYAVGTSERRRAASGAQT